MLCVAYTELEVDLACVLGADISHEASNLIQNVGGEICVLVDGGLKVDTVPVDEHLVEGQLGELNFLALLCAAGVDPEGDCRAVVDDLRAYPVKHRGEGSRHLDHALLGVGAREAVHLARVVAHAHQTRFEGHGVKGSEHVHCHASEDLW